MNKSFLKKAIFPAIVIFLVLLADQVLKVWIKTSMYLGEEFNVMGLSWFKMHFTENEGMAFGMTLGGDYGKLALSLFRIVAVLFIGIYLFKLLEKPTPTGLILCISLIFSGALGNIIDSAFYGVIFEESSDYHRNVARAFPEGGGYAPLLHGKVVDMLYFPVYNNYLPEWVPFWGGKHFLFFRPVFNIADVAITLGVFLIIIFQRSYFKEEDKQDEEAERAANSKETPETTNMPATPVSGAENRDEQKGNATD